MPADKIAQLNDRFRKGDPTISGKSFVTAGIIQILTVQNIPIAEQADLMIAYSDFTEENDPYGEHDFGAFEMGRQKCFWTNGGLLWIITCTGINLFKVA